MVHAPSSLNPVLSKDNGDRAAAQACMTPARPAGSDAIMVMRTIGNRRRADAIGNRRGLASSGQHPEGVEDVLSTSVGKPLDAGIRIYGSCFQSKL
jgi:hypothetical protein